MATLPTRPEAARPVARILLALGVPVIAVLVLSGCATVGPDYVRPETPLPAEWHNQLEEDTISGDVASPGLAEWWSVFGDTLLSNLVESAVENNLDLKQAQARVREARAKRGATKADYFPTIDASGSVSTSHVERDDGSEMSNESYSAGLDAGWELDLFGGVRRSVEASTADQEASEEDLRDVLVSLISEVALNYTNVRVYQARLYAAEKNLELQNETYQLIFWRNQAGLSDSLEVQQARYNLENTRSLIPSLQTGLEEAMNHIAILLGQHPGSVHQRLQERADVPVALSQIAVGIPADIIRRRPDIRKAERQLAAQTARVGVAMAELYPKFKLSGSIGLEALSLDGLFSSADETSSGGGLISLPIFNAGSIRNNVKAQSAAQEQYLIAYEAAVLNSLEEVENALFTLAREQERQEALSEATQACADAAELAQRKYEAGLVDFSDVLDAQRSLVSFQDQLVESEGTLTSDLIRLYKALGGGWNAPTVEDQKVAHNTETNEL